MISEHTYLPTPKQLTQLQWLPLRIAGYLHTVYLAVVFILLIRPSQGTYSQVYDRWFTPMYRYYLVFWGVQFVYFVVLRARALYYYQKVKYPADVFCLSLVYYMVLAFEIIILLMIAFHIIS